METATKAPQGVRQADKVLEALATLAALLDRTINEVKSLDSDFQNRLMQAVHDTEASLQAQTAEHVDRAKQEVQEALDAKFQGDLQSALDGLKSEFEVERERFNKDLQQAAEAASKLESERSGLIAEVQRVKDDSAAERERFNKELLHAVEAASQLEAERSGLISEVQRVKDDSAAEVEKAREEARAAAAKAPAAAPAAAGPVLSASLQEEMSKSEARLQEILKIIDDPATELSKVIRLNVEKSEVEAYLRGIRVALNGNAK